MQTLLAVFGLLTALLLVGLSVVHYLGWFEVRSHSRKGQRRNYFAVDKNKIAAGKGKVAQKVKAM